MTDTSLLCDFCSALDPAWRYPAQSFVAYCAPNIAGESVGDWAACDRCHILIEANDRSGLAQRSVDELIARDPEARAAAAVLYEKLAELHREFFAHRSGPAAPIPANAA
jgi:hypothetical protein